ncbi:MAG: putative spermidine/putrescine transport system permease protein [Arcobacteraceae bacterium]|jgi:putative spermidine/putrescine transport system permease protein
MNNITFRKTDRVEKLKAFMLVSPLLLFVLVFFVTPICIILLKGIYNPKVKTLLPNTVVSIQNYDYKQPFPDEGTLKIFVSELKYVAKNGMSGVLAEELNRQVPGFSSTIKKTARQLKKIDIEDITSYKEYLLKVSKRWDNPQYWITLKRSNNAFTLTNILSALDLEYNLQGVIVQKEESSQIYLPILLKTLYMAFLITILTMILAYPTSYYLSTLPKSKANLLMIFVLLPFWTSILVRIVSWMTLLQDKGVANDIMLYFNIINQPLDMMFNQFATIITMTHILLPFMVLPLYGSMRAMDKTYLKASSSLGANPITTFFKIYFPLTISGLSAGAILVFIISVGYYITPALVGGVDGQMISNMIEYHMRTSNNWNLASAMGGILLFITIVLYWTFNKLVGVNSLKLG